MAPKYSILLFTVAVFAVIALSNARRVLGTEEEEDLSILIFAKAPQHEEASGKWIVCFGYSSSFSEATVIPRGSKNYLKPDEFNTNKYLTATSFRGDKECALRILVDEPTEIAWYLTAPDGVERQAKVEKEDYVMPSTTTTTAIPETTKELTTSTTTIATTTTTATPTTTKETEVPTTTATPIPTQTVEVLPPPEERTKPVPVIEARMVFSIGVDELKAKEMELRLRLAAAAHVTVNAVRIISIKPGSTVVHFEVETEQDPETVTTSYEDAMSKGGILETFHPIVEAFTCQRRSGPALFALGTGFYFVVAFGCFAGLCALGWAAYRRRYPDPSLKTVPVCEVRDGVVRIQVKGDASNSEKADLLTVGPTGELKDSSVVRMPASGKLQPVDYDAEPTENALPRVIRARSPSTSVTGGASPPPALTPPAGRRTTKTAARRHRSRQYETRSGEEGVSGTETSSELASDSETERQSTPQRVAASSQSPGSVTFQEMTRHLQPSREITDDADIGVGYALE